MRAPTKNSKSKTNILAAKQHNIITYFNGKPRGELHVDKVLQLLEVSVGDGQEVHDGHHLLLQGQGVILAQPQLRPELLTLLTFLPGSETGLPGLQI